MSELIESFEEDENQDEAMIEIQRQQKELLQKSQDLKQEIGQIESNIETKQRLLIQLKNEIQKKQKEIDEIKLKLESTANKDEFIQLLDQYVEGLENIIGQEINQIAIQENQYEKLIQQLVKKQYEFDKIKEIRTKYYKIDDNQKFINDCIKLQIIQKSLAQNQDVRQKNQKQLKQQKQYLETQRLIFEDTKRILQLKIQLLKHLNTNIPQFENKLFIVNKTIAEQEVIISKLEKFVQKYETNQKIQSGSLFLFTIIIILLMLYCGWQSEIQMYDDSIIYQ